MKEIIKALAKAQGEFPKIVKDSVNPHFKSRYCDYETLLGAVQPVLAKNGITITHGMVTANGHTDMVTKLVHIETGEELVSAFPMVLDGNPQHTGSMMSYGKRYNLEALTAVAATEDDDGNAASHAPKPAQPPKTTPATPQKAATRPSEGNTGAIGGWRNVAVPMGKNKGKLLGAMTNQSIQWYHKEYTVSMRKDGTPWPDSQAFREALDQWHDELEAEQAGGGDDIQEPPGGEDDVPF